MHKIEYLDESIQDLHDIFSYISQDNFENAGKVLLSIKNTIENLSFFPFLGRKLDKKYRMMVDTKYKYQIVYFVEDENVYITSIFKYKKL